MTVLIVVETAVLLVLSVLVVGLLRSYATVLQRLHRLDGGVDPAPPAPLSSAGAAHRSARPTASSDRRKARSGPWARTSPESRCPVRS